MKTFTRLFVLSATLFATTAQAQYCMLPGRTPYDTDEPGITEFKLNTIDRTSSNVESMSSVVVEANDSTILQRGHTYTVTIVHTRDLALFPTVRNNIRVWIDYNHNYSFEDAGETVISSDYQTYGTYTNTFTVPLTAPLGTTMLRATAKMSSDGGHTLPTSCDTPADPIGYHGEMEDYKVMIQVPTAIAPVASVHSAVVYPNPTQENFTVAFNDIAEQPISVTLYDLQGRMVSELLHEQVQSALTYNFNINDYVSNTGVWFLKITAGAYTSCQKVIKAD